MKKTDLPLSFQSTIQQLLGEQSENFFQSLEAQEQTSIRYHPKSNLSKHLVGQAVEWEENAVYLDERPIFALDPAWHSGAYYVQESSSMLTGYVCKQLFTQAVKVLDLCAAPGGKSTHLLSVLPEDSLLVSNEIIAKRNHILVENIEKWGYSNVVVTKAEAHEFQNLDSFFDLIVVDAPCSGEGLFRRQAEAVQEWSEENVLNCIFRQEKILNDIHLSLKKGGYLCYSTCTFEEGENEHQVQKLLDSGLYELVPIEEQVSMGLVSGSLKGTLRCWPHLVKGSGFFIALLKKVAHSQEDITPNKKRFWNWELLKKAPAVIFDFIQEKTSLQLYQSGEYLRAFPKKYQYELLMIAQQVSVTHFGIHLGQLKKGIFSPAQGLVHSDILNPSVSIYPVEELSVALDFLRKKDIPIQPEVKNGWAIVRYQNHNLGWVKQNQQRVNNYYPQHLMLRMS